MKNYIFIKYTFYYVNLNFFYNNNYNTSLKEKKSEFQLEKFN